MFQILKQFFPHHSEIFPFFLDYIFMQSSELSLILSFDLYIHNLNSCSIVLTQIPTGISPIVYFLLVSPIHSHPDAPLTFFISYIWSYHSLI